MMRVCAALRGTDPSRAAATGRTALTRRGYPDGLHSLADRLVFALPTG